MASKVELPATLFAIDDRRFIRRMAEQMVVWIAGAFAIASGNAPAVFAGALLLGVVYARNLEFVHECLHATALRSRRANRIAGTLLGIPMLVSFVHWRREHAQHHRDVRREGFRYEYERLTTKRELLLHVFMVRHFAAALRRFDLPIVIALACVCVAALLAHSVIPLVLWFAPLPVAALVHTHIELPEHLGLAGASTDAFANSRTIPANSLVTWFVNANNYHALHHWNARIPTGSLAAAHARVTDRMPIATSTYGDFFGWFYRRFVTSIDPEASHRI